MTVHPVLVVISGPSGSGKGTLCNLLRRELPGLVYSVSATTRPPRPGETDGVDYFFMTRDDFLRKIRAGWFLEWAQVYDHYYGTPRVLVENGLQSGKDVLLELDIQGAKQVKQNIPQAVLVFILPPSLEELDARIKKRGTDSDVTIRKRMAAACTELRAAADYDYSVVNDRQERALDEILGIIEREKKRFTAN